MTKILSIAIKQSNGNLRKHNSRYLTSQHKVDWAYRHVIIVSYSALLQILRRKLKCQRLCHFSNNNIIFLRKRWWTDITNDTQCKSLVKWGHKENDINGICQELILITTENKNNGERAIHQTKPALQHKHMTARAGL